MKEVMSDIEASSVVSWAKMGGWEFPNVGGAADAWSTNSQIDIGSQVNLRLLVFLRNLKSLPNRLLYVL